MTTRADPAAALAAARELRPALAARAADHDRAGVFPTADFADLRAAGLLGLMVPTRLGGAGAGFADYAEVAMSSAPGQRRDRAGVQHARLGDRRAGAVHAGRGGPGARRAGVVLRHARPGPAPTPPAGRFYAVAMSERGVGIAAVQADHVVRAGRRRLPRPGLEDVLLRRRARRRLPGRGPPHRRARRRSRTSSCPAGPGLVVEQTWDSLGMRATGSHDLHLDVVASADALLGGVEGLTLLLAQVMPQWLVASYAAVYVGVAQSAVDAAVEHLQARGLTQLPAVRARVGRADAQVAAARLVVLEAARRVDAAPGDAGDEPLGVAGQAAGRRDRDGRGRLDAGGGRHLGDPRAAIPLERIFRDARCGSLQPATSDVCADWLGAAALGGDPDGGQAVVRLDGDRTHRRDAGTRVPGGMHQEAAVGRLLRRALRRDRAASPSSCSPTPASDPARRGQPGATRTSPAGAPGRGWSATWPRRCRWARTRCRPRSPTPGSTAADVGLFAVVSCTGYVHARAWTSCSPATWACPTDVQRLFVGHMGCYAALPGLGAAADFTVARDRPVGAALPGADRACTCSPPATTGGPRGRRAAGGRARAVLRRGGRRRAAPADRPGCRGARRGRAHRLLHRRPHDLGRHRSRLPDGAVAAGAGRAGAARRARSSTTCSRGHGARPRRGGRLGGAPRRPADPRRGAGPARARPRRAWCRPARSCATTATAPRATVLLVLDRVLATGTSSRASTSSRWPSVQD